jgi:hypothetical protein
VRVGDDQRLPRDLRRPRQRCAPGRVDQPRPAPQQGDQEQLRVRVEPQRQHGRVAGRLELGVRVGGTEHRDPQRHAVVEHRLRADRHGAGTDEPAAGRLVAVLQPGQPDAVAVAHHVQRV